MKRLILLSVVFLLGAACSPKVKTKPETIGQRTPSSPQEEMPKLLYFTYKTNGESLKEEITEEKWRGIVGHFSAGSREDYLLKIYYANTRGISLKGYRHAACFYGDAESFRRSFFAEGESQTVIRDLKKSWPVTRASSDGRILGIRFDHKRRGNLYFRISHCESGKSTVSQKSVLEGRGSSRFSPPAKSHPSSAARSIANTSKSQYGFQILDQAVDRALPQFQLRADYEKASEQKEERPWAGLHLRDPKEALRFALQAQKYFYEGMANQNPNRPDFNFIAKQNTLRYWCHMPWMNVGHVGREAVHGLTQERDLVASAKIPVYSKATPGTNWGVAYFNAPGCRTLNQVFGSESNPKPKPDFDRGQFENGTFIAKILFTTADFPEIKGAYLWKANATEVGSTERKIRPVRHIQMDIAVKDSSLKGVNPLLSNWVMIGFYYDPNYDYDKELKPLLGEDHPLSQIPNLPPELLKMRPIGVQTGFESPTTGDTIIFAGAQSNGSGGRLNGPADNPKSSCMGCHGAAGTKAAMIPGFLSMKMFEPHQGTTILDFNQQLALAKANYETEISATEGK